jgi:hypothetical protein
VTTHGRLDQILPSQFALDETDFLRRLAEQELLYFRREEPPLPTRQEMIVLLDQGVRTWGDVRLVLGAAVLALGRQASRRGVPFFVAATGNGGQPLDPLQADDEALGQLIEASDLMANPGLALEGVLETTSDWPRDVVLLTHPRNLTEEDVRVAARRLAPRDRLFALALDAHGAASLSELRRGVPVKLREFRIDFSRSAPRPVPAPDKSQTGSSSWQGDVEPVGYPFRFGVAGMIWFDRFAFDHGGEWVLAASDHGMLHAWSTDGDRGEILPRGLLNGVVLASVDGLAGVAGGFVVTGRIGNQLVLFHYDFVARRCTGRPLGDLNPPAPLFYLPECHAVVAATDTFTVWWILDLRTGFHDRADDTLDPAKPTARAWEICRNRGTPVWSIPVVDRRGGQEILGTSASCNRPCPPTCQVDSERGEVSLLGLPPWGVFTPRADGQPALKGCSVRRAQCRGQTLALLCTQPGAKDRLILRLFRGPEGRVLASYPMNRRDADFTLSSDGEWVAFKAKRARLEIRRVLADAPPVLTHTGGCSGKLELFLGRHSLLLFTGQQNTHLLRWGTGKLEWSLSREGGSGAMLSAREVGMAVALKGRGPDRLPDCLRYDPERFVLGAERTEFRAFGDRYGQVVLFDCRNRLLCLFFAFREHLGGWMPDGTRLGPSWLTGGPPSPQAAEKFGRVLWTASEGRGPS